MSQERRKAYRLPVLEEQQPAQLRVGDATIQARLLDQSATGFSVLVEQHPGVYPGEQIWLETDSGWNSVRVVKVRHETQGTRIGLERAGDFAVASADRSEAETKLLGDEVGHRKPPGASMLILGMVLAVVCVAGSIVWTAFLKPDAQWKSVVFGDSPDLDLHRAAAVRAMRASAERRGKLLRQAAEEFSVLMLSLPEVSKVLQLTATQQQEIDAIAQLAAQLDSQPPSPSPPQSALQSSEQTRRLIAAAGGQALALLTPEQKARWDALLAEAAQSIE